MANFKPVGVDENGKFPQRVQTALNATYAPKWKADTAYAAGEAVLNPAGDIVTAKTAFTSAASYNPSNWNLSASYATPAQAFGNAIAAALIFGD